MTTNNCDNFTSPISVNTGGTGSASFTAYSVICGGTSSTGQLQNVSGVGTSGQLLTSNGGSALPSWQNAPAGSFNLTSLSVTLTSAQVKALHGTPVQIVAAPGSGKVICVLDASASMNYGGSNVFTAGAGQTIDLYYGTTLNASSGLLLNTSIVASTSKFGRNSFSGLSSFAYTSYNNIAINAYNSSATEISGNAAGNNTVTISILYTTITI